MLFDYDLEKKYLQTLDVPDIGNVSIRCTSLKNEDYYLLIKTIMGRTLIFTCGPVMPDTTVLLNEYTSNYKEINYSEKAICKTIKQFINDPKKAISIIVEVDPEELFQALPDIKETYNGF